MNAPLKPEREALAVTWSLSPLRQNLRDSYNQESKWYCLTFKPFNKAYDKDSDWFSNSALQAVRKKLPRGIQILTREVEATKVHINALISTDMDMVTKFHNKTILNKFKCWCIESTDKQGWFDYIFKESRNRQFIKLKDYYIYNPILNAAKINFKNDCT